MDNISNLQIDRDHYIKKPSQRRGFLDVANAVRVCNFVTNFINKILNTVSLGKVAWLATRNLTFHHHCNCCGGDHS